MVLDKTADLHWNVFSCVECVLQQIYPYTWCKTNGIIFVFLYIKQTFLYCLRAFKMECNMPYMMKCTETHVTIVIYNDHGIIVFFPFLIHLNGKVCRRRANWLSEIERSSKSNVHSLMLTLFQTVSYRLIDYGLINLFTYNISIRHLPVLVLLFELALVALSRCRLQDWQACWPLRRHWWSME